MARSWIAFVYGCLAKLKCIADSSGLHPYISRSCRFQHLVPMDVEVFDLADAPEVSAAADRAAIHAESPGVGSADVLYELATK